MNESEQAQAIAEIRAAHDLDMHFVGKLEDTVILQLLCHRKDLLKIVDSQAQKIEQLEADVSNLLNKMALWPSTFERQERQIAEQAKEIERLKAQHSEFLAGIGFQP